MGAILASIAGTIAALMVAVDIVSERNRKVYELFVIRPIRREAIIIAKFLAVFVCVTIACLLSMALGIVVDAIRGSPPTMASAYDIVKSMTMLVGVIAISAGVGVLFGVMSRTILVAVVLILYVGQGITFVPMMPMYFGVLPNQFWIVMVVSAVIAALLLLAASAMFRRSEF
jgi:ABC-type transport system involved in multi-copper enzyme maturation permease subunit